LITGCLVEARPACYLVGAQEIQRSRAVESPEGTDAKPAIVAAAIGGVLLAGRGTGTQRPQVIERVDVSRVVVDVHALDSAGRPMAGLGPADFRAWVDGAPVRVESVRWVTDTRTQAAPDAGRESDARSATTAGRRVVIMAQVDLDASRVEGLMGLLKRARAFVAGLPPEDEVAVVAFRHRLEWWCGFTRDRARVSRILDRGLLFDAAPEPTAPESGRLGQALPAQGTRQAESVERALLVLASALEGEPGATSVVLFGFGFGRILAAGDVRSIAVDVDGEYREAADRLTRARVTVYCLDVTQASSHTLDSGLRLVAADTGGFYLSTAEFPGLAMARLADALAGHYEVTCEPPARPRGTHAIRIELAGRRGRVLARRTYTG
jgi:VWFA-related protein